jgi:hypothetical protein
MFSFEVGSNFLIITEMNSMLQTGDTFRGAVCSEMSFYAVFFMI